MGRPQQEKFDCREQFELLYKEMNIDGDTDMLRLMHREYYRHQEGVTDKRIDWIEKNKSNFSNKKKGERPFTLSDICAIERVTGKCFVDIVYPKGDTQPRGEFIPKGIRYAAHLDEESEYEALYESELIKRYDEYDKNLTDYIVEMRSRNGLKFMVKKGLLKLDDFRKLWDYATYSCDRNSELLSWIFELDEPELFFGVMEERILFSPMIFDKNGEEEFVEQLLGTENIFAALLKMQKKKLGEREVGYMYGLALLMLKCALKKGMEQRAGNILSAYERYVDGVISELSRLDGIDHDTRWNILCGRQDEISTYDYGTLAYLWNFEGVSGYGEQMDSRIAALSAESVTERIVERTKCRDVMDMRMGDSFEQDGVRYLVMEDCFALSMLEQISTAGVSDLPRFMGRKHAAIMHASTSPYRPENVSEVAEMLGRIHSASHGILTDGVACYGHDLRFGITSEGDHVITSWESAVRGTAAADVVTAFINGFGLGYMNNDDTVIRAFYERRAELYRDLCDFITAYPCPELLVGFGDVLNLEVDRMIAEALGKGRESRVSALYMIKSFAEIYRTFLNDLTAPRESYTE